MIAALYVQTNGVYFGLPGVDPWDEARDARKYRGPHPAVLHPPCAAWCKFAGQREHRYGLRRGDDGGCFAHAIDTVCEFGGVLEHPAHSAAWAKFLLPEPPARGWAYDILRRGWVCSVDQVDYGHRANKPTWLYFNPGMRVFALPQLRYGVGVPAVKGTTKRTGAVAMLSRTERSRTPLPFRDLLLSMARSVLATHSVTKASP